MPTGAKWYVRIAAGIVAAATVVTMLCIYALGLPVTTQQLFMVISGMVVVGVGAGCTWLPRTAYLRDRAFIGTVVVVWGAMLVILTLLGVIIR